jgi:lipoate-protein ligase A
LGKPDPLFIDVDDETLYWADGVLHLIEYYDITSGNRKVLVSSQIVQPTGMAVFGKYLYWIDRDSMLMSRVDKDTGIASPFQRNAAECTTHTGKLTRRTFKLF